MQSKGKQNRRGGFTLSELLVVLGLLVVMAAVAQPALRRTMDDSRLRSAAKRVRAELTKARIKAMQSGVAQQFRYQVGKGHFEIAPATVGRPSSDRDRQGENARVDARAQSAKTADAGESSGEAPVEQDLPEGVLFFEAASLGEPSMTVGEDGWSDPILFYPNGKTENAQIHLKGERNAVVDLSLRGMTGVVTATKPRYEEEVR